MNFKKGLLIISIILCILISLSAVSANENAAELTAADSASDDDLSLDPISDETALSAENSNEDDSLESELPEDLDANENSIDDSLLESETSEADESSVNDLEELGNAEVNEDNEALTVENGETDEKNIVSQVVNTNENSADDNVLQDTYYYYDDYYSSTSDVSTSLKVKHTKPYKDKTCTVKVYVKGLSDSIGYVHLYINDSYFDEAQVKKGVATFKLVPYVTGKFTNCYAYYSGGKDHDQITHYSGSYSSYFTLNVKAKAKITVTNYKSYFNSGKKYTIKVKNTATGGVHKNLKIKIYLYKKGKKVSTKTAYTNSKGIYKGNITKGVGTYKMVVKIAEKGFSYKAGKAKVKVVKSRVKIKAYKSTSGTGYTSYVEATVQDKKGKYLNVGYVRFRINGKIYKAKVRDGYAYRSLKLKKAKTYTYSATYINKNYYKKKVKSKIKVYKTHKTKIIIPKVVGYQNTKKTVHFYVRTKSGKKVSGGYISCTMGGKTNWYKVNKKGHAKFRMTFGSNYQGYYYYTDFYGYRHYTDYYKKKVKSYYSVKYYSTSCKYKDSKGTLKVVRKYKCGYCGSKKSHSHSPYYRYVVY